MAIYEKKNCMTTYCFLLIHCFIEILHLLLFFAFVKKQNQYDNINKNTKHHKKFTLCGQAVQLNIESLAIHKHKKAMNKAT